MYYKGYLIYWISSNRWRVQVGYNVLGDYRTIRSAKSAITRELKRG